MHVVRQSKPGLSRRRPPQASRLVGRQAGVGGRAWSGETGGNVSSAKPFLVDAGDPNPLTYITSSPSHPAVRFRRCAQDTPLIEFCVSQLEYLRKFKHSATTCHTLSPFPAPTRLRRDYNTALPRHSERQQENTSRNGQNSLQPVAS